MQAYRGNLFNRDDVLLGICEAVGEDLGFNPTWLRIVFAASLLWNPTIVIGTYLGLGLVVLISRLVAPRPKATAAPAIEKRDLDSAEDRDQELAEAA